MAGSNDFTGRNIQDTYQRVLQLSSSGQLADGTGSLVPLLDVTASFAVSASHEIIKEVSSSHANIADNLSIGANISVGQITASGDISASGDGIFNNLDIDGNIKLDNGSAIYSEFTNRGRVDLFSSTTKNAVNVKLYGGTANLELQHDTGVEITGDLTASGNISSSGTVIANGIRTTVAGGINLGPIDSEGILIKNDTQQQLTIAQGNDINTPYLIVNPNGVTIPTIIGGTSFNDENITNVGIIDVDKIRADSDSDVTIQLDASGYQFNLGEKDKNFIYYDIDEDTLIHGDAGLSRVGISDTSPSSKLDVGGDLNVQSHITASGNISASGNIIASQFHIGGNGTTFTPLFLTHHVAGDNLQIIGGGLLVDSHITASSNISASGTINASSLKLDNITVADVDDSHLLLGSSTVPVHIKQTSLSVGPETTVGHITASGNISSSGAVIASSFVMDTNTNGIEFRASNGNLFNNILTNASDDFIVQNLKNNENLRLRAGQSANKGKVLIQQGGTSTDIALFGPESQIEFNGDITASGNISASGHITTGTLRGNTFGDQSGSLTLSGSLTFKANQAHPAESASALYLSKGGPTTIQHSADDFDLRFGRSGLTPAFAWVTLDDEGTDTASEILFGVGSAVTSTSYNMDVVHDTTTNGTRIYAHLDGIYKVTANLSTDDSSGGTVIYDINVDGSTVHTVRNKTHQSVDPVERTQIYVGTINSGSYVTTTADGASFKYMEGSVLLVERLA